MKRRNVYTVYYRMYGSDVKMVDVIAYSKADAYDTAVYEKIMNIEKQLPYSAWVSSVTYQNGNCKHFNTHEGNPY